MKKLILLAIIAIASFTSCTKEQVQDTVANTNVSFGFRIGGTWVTLSLGNGGGGYYYDQQYYDSYQNPPQGSSYYDNNSNVTVCYIVSKPNDPTSIAVCDRYGRFIATVSSVTGNWQQDNYYFQQLQNWNYNNGPCAVLVKWDPKWTSGPWTGKI